MSEVKKCDVCGVTVTWLSGSDVSECRHQIRFISAGCAALEARLEEAEHERDVALRALHLACDQGDGAQLNQKILVDGFMNEAARHEYAPGLALELEQARREKRPARMEFDDGHE